MIKIMHIRRMNSSRLAFGKKLDLDYPFRLFFLIFLDLNVIWEKLINNYK